MSQIKFKTKDNKNREVEITGGWDTEKKTHHLTVVDLNKNNAVIWSSIDQIGIAMIRPPRDMFQKVLSKMGILAKDDFWSKMAKQKEGGSTTGEAEVEI